jgi:hypothetical protein
MPALAAKALAAFWALVLQPIKSKKKRKTIWALQFITSGCNNGLHNRKNNFKVSLFVNIQSKGKY